MPVLNKRVIEYAMKVAKSVNCTIADESEFARKNYFYPDLNKAYQITQYDKPLALGGYVEIEGDDGKERKIQLTRIHVEEDPGRLVHMGNAERGRYSLVDYNRAGIPLIEIVSEPDMRSPKEARKFLNKCGPRSNTSAYSIQKKKDRSGSMLTSRSGAASAWRSKTSPPIKGSRRR